MNGSQNRNRAHQGGIGRARRKRFPWWTLPVIAVCGTFLVLAYLFASEQISLYNQFNTKRAAVSGDTFYGNIIVDGIALHGLTMEEAKRQLQEQKQQQDLPFEVFVAHDAQTWRISADEVPLLWNTDLQLEKAYMIGRTGTLDERYAQVRNLTDPVYLTSDYVYDHSIVRELTDTIAARLSYPAEDANVVAFDAVNRSFAFSMEKPGQAVDAETLYETVIRVLDRREYGRTVMPDVYEVPAKVTRASLSESYGRISTYSTITTNDSNRNNNIRLGAMAINGSSIPAGGTLSFNETTGQRTAEKGYREAGAIENGRTIQEIGGGICQVSTTLFNALARANCDIVRRKPHAWPSDYVPRGEDATVDWPGVDLVMKNPTDAPMFVVAWYENQQITVEIYGRTMEQNTKINLESETIYTKKPDETVYTYNPELSIGSMQLLKKARTGYTVQTYRVYYRDGVEVSREKFYVSEYPVIYEEYEYNDGKPPQ